MTLMLKLMTMMHTLVQNATGFLLPTIVLQKTGQKQQRKARTVINIIQSFFQ
jgi:hypothetical protein